MAALLDLLKRKPKEETPPPPAEQPMTTEQIIRYVRRGMGPRIMHARMHNLLSLDHPDVDLTAPAEDQVLAWNELLGKWKAKTMIGMAIHGNEYHDPEFISSETDPTVDATLKGITLTQVQDHDPKAHTLTSHSTKAHAELTDVTANQHHNKVHALAHVDHPDVQITSPADNEVLTYESATSLWKNKKPSLQSKAYKVAHQTIPPATWTLFLLDAVAIDDESIFSASDYGFKIKKAGRYLVIAREAWNSSEGLFQWNVSVAVNGYRRWYVQAWNAIAGDIRACAMDVMDLGVNDIVTLQAYQDTAANRTCYGFQANTVLILIRLR